MNIMKLISAIFCFGFIVGLFPLKAHSLDVGDVTLSEITEDDVNSQTKFNFGRAIAVGGVGSVNLIHQVWVEIDPLSSTSGEVDGKVMYRMSPNGGNIWTEPKEMSNVIRTGYPKVAAYGSYVYITYHETDVPTGSHQVKVIFSEDPLSDWFDSMGQPIGGLPISTLISTIGWFPSIVAYQNYVHVAFSDELPGGSYSEVFYRRGQVNSSSISWDDGVLVSSNDSRSSWTPDIAVYAPDVTQAGHEVYIVWTDERHNSLGDCKNPVANPNEVCLEEVYMSRSPDLGVSWGVEQRVTSTPDGVGHNAASVFVADDDAINPGNPVVHIAATRKVKPEQDPDQNDRKIVYVRTDSAGNVIGEAIVAQDPSIAFGRPSVVADGDRVQIAFHGIEASIGGKLYLLELKDYGTGFFSGGELPVSLLVGQLIQPSLIVDRDRKSHLIFTYDAVPGNSNFQMFYANWDLPENWPQN